LLLIKRFKMRRRSKLRLLNIEKSFCRSNERKLKQRNSNLLKATKLKSKNTWNKSKQKKLSKLLKKEVMLKRSPDSKLHVIKKHVKLLMLKS
jgi:hypothetical protein